MVKKNANLGDLDRFLVEAPPLGRDEGQLSNGGAEAILATAPYIVGVTVRGVVPVLFHNYNAEAVAEKAGAAKGSKEKKSDNIESFAYRDKDGNLGIPGSCLTAACVNAGRYRQDPRSPRKSMMDLLKAGLFPLTIVAPLKPHTARWDYEDARRAVIGRAAVTRVRPAMREGWTCTFEMMVNTPEYLPEGLLLDIINDAGRLCGLCDYRPTYGRFSVVKFEVLR